MKSAAAFARTAKAPYGLADHFVSCAKMGRYLTDMGTGRFIISDDLYRPDLPQDAVAVASIFSKDELVARAALLPLSRMGHDRVHRARYEELFHLIEQQTLSPRVKAEAAQVIEGGFREARIRELEAQLHDELDPARVRYRAFLEVVRELAEGRVSTGYFLDEFVDFTNQVAGKLDFGIYSFCLDRIFASPQIAVKVKKLLTVELMRYPPLIRRELLTNIMVNKAVPSDFKGFVRHAVSLHLEKERAVEIDLLEAVKLKRVSAADIELSLHAQAQSHAPGRA